jgi:hypothetical protein
MTGDLGGLGATRVDHGDIDSRAHENPGEGAAHRAGTDDECAFRHGGLRPIAR